MQITINQTQIERAIMDYMRKRINLMEGTKLSIEMRATRGAEGFSAIVDIIDDEDDFAAVQEEEKARIKEGEEEALEKAGRFLGKASAKSIKKTAAKPEKETKASEPVADDSAGDDEKEATTETKEEKGTSKPKSIFSNVTKA